jgi:plastocyanin
MSLLPFPEIPMNRARVLCLVTAVALVGVVRAAAPITVTQKGLQFSVEDLSVSKGQVVVFVNDDRTAHNITVTGEGVSLNGGLQQPGAEFKVPFVKPGTYQVSCGIHPKMKLSVTVK